MTTAEQTMQCCNTIRWYPPNNRHSQQSMDCCETLPQIHPVLGQPLSVQAISFTPAALRLMPGFGNFRLMEISREIIGAHAHDPLSRALKMFPLRV